jgi:hypothetical protein
VRWIESLDWRWEALDGLLEGDEEDVAVLVVPREEAPAYRPSLRLRGPEGAPVPSYGWAQIDRGGSAASISFTADDEGTWIGQRALEPHTYRCRLHVTGYRDTDFLLSVGAGPVQVELDRGCALRGVVSSAAGGPVADARVTIDDQSGWTGANGRFEITGLVEGVHEAVVSGPHVPRTRRSVRVDAFDGRADFVVRTGGAVEITMQRPEWEWLDSPPISLRAADGASIDLTLSGMECGNSLYSAEWFAGPLDPGRYLACHRAPSGLEERVEVEVRDRATARVTLPRHERRPLLEHVRQERDDGGDAE